LADPLGLDVPAPRLSWRLNANDAEAHAQRQTSYHVLVADQAALLTANRGNLWDSGVVSSDESLNIAYGGKPLTSGQQCFWKVRVKDERGRLSSWSRPAHWTMGLLTPSDWKAKWIGTDQVFVKGNGYPPPDNQMPDPWLRKTFKLSSAPLHAVAYVASVGYHELYLKRVRTTRFSARNLR